MCSGCNGVLSPVGCTQDYSATKSVSDPYRINITCHYCVAGNALTPAVQK